MITGKELEEILKVYAKHGWECDRLLVSKDSGNVLKSSETFQILAEKIVNDADIDAIWFRRTRKDGDISWEIRHLSTSPYALCESFPADAAIVQIEKAKRKMENRVRTLASK